MNAEPAALYAVCLTVNGRRHDLDVQPHERLIDVLRGRLGLTGAKLGCGEGECGACTVLMNGKAVPSCLVLAVQANGAEIVTIEGLAAGGGEAQLHPLQRAFVEHQAIQCGYCAPGMILAAKSLLDHDPDPTEERVRQALAGNLCRCTGYAAPVRAVLAAAAELRAQTECGSGEE